MKKGIVYTRNKTYSMLMWPGTWFNNNFVIHCYTDKLKPLGKPQILNDTFDWQLQKETNGLSKEYRIYLLNTVC